MRNENAFYKALKKQWQPATNKPHFGAAFLLPKFPERAKTAATTALPSDGRLLTMIPKSLKTVTVHHLYARVGTADGESFRGERGSRGHSSRTQHARMSGLPRLVGTGGRGRGKSAARTEVRSSVNRRTVNGVKRYYWKRLKTPNRSILGAASVSLLLGAVLFFTGHEYGVIFTSIGLMLLLAAWFTPGGPFSRPPSDW